MTPQINAGINHLVEVQHVIWEGRMEWRTLGLELGLSPDTLKTISGNHAQSVNDCFCEMISEWLRSGSRPSWEVLMSALKSPIVGLQGLAFELEDKVGKVSACISWSLSHHSLTHSYNPF